MRKTLIIIGLLISLTGYGQTVVNKRVMLDTIRFKAGLISPSFLGTVTTASLNIGGTALTIDSAKLIDGKIALYDGPDTVGVYVMATDRADLEDYALMLTDTANMLTHYIERKDTATMLSHYALLSETGGGGLSAGDVAGQINDTIVARLNAAAAGVRVIDTATMLAPYFTISEIRKVNSDTIPLFVFGGGAGLTADTAFFNNGALAGSFYNSGSDTLHVTSLRGVLKEGTGTETIDVGVKWHATFLSGSAVALNTTDLTITSITTGTVDASFNNNDIPPGVFVWCTLSGASANNKPTHLCLTMTGYKVNRRY